MLRFTSKCSLLLLAVMPRWAYAELKCSGGGFFLYDESKCHVEDVNFVFKAELDECRGNENYVSDLDARWVECRRCRAPWRLLRCP